jgi:hypothetical protein
VGTVISGAAFQIAAVLFSLPAGAGHPHTNGAPTQVVCTDRVGAATECWGVLADGRLIPVKPPQEKKP